MKRFIRAMLLTTVAAGVSAAATAQTAIPVAPGRTPTTGNDTAGTEQSLLGTGSSSIQNVLVQQANCIGGSNQLGEFESGVTAALLGPVGSVVLGGIGSVAIAVAWARLFPELAARDRLVALPVSPS